MSNVVYTEKDIIRSISYPSGVQEVVVDDHRIVVGLNFDDNTYRAYSADTLEHADADTEVEAVLKLANMVVQAS